MREQARSAISVFFAPSTATRSGGVRRNGYKRRNRLDGAAPIPRERRHDMADSIFKERRVRKGALASPRPVIPRAVAGGVSSTLRLLDCITGASEYWIGRV